MTLWLWMEFVFKYNESSLKVDGCHGPFLCVIFVVLLSLEFHNLLNLKISFSSSHYHSLQQSVCVHGGMVVFWLDTAHWYCHSVSDWTISGIYNNRNKWGEPKLFSKYLVLTIRYMCFFHYSVVLQAQNLGPLCWKIQILNALWFVPGVDQNIVCVLLAVLSSWCFPFLFSFTQSSSNIRSDVSPENQIFLHTGPWLNVLYHLAARWSKIVYFTHAPTHHMCVCTHTLRRAL